MDFILNMYNVHMFILNMHNDTMCICPVYINTYIHKHLIFYANSICLWYYLGSNYITEMTGNTLGAPGDSFCYSEVITERLKRYFAFHLRLSFIELG